jgi:hypothetical protein
LLTSNIVITTNREGEYILKLDIANKGGDLINCSAVISFFEFTKEGQRLKPYYKMKSYSLIEHETVNIFSISLEKMENEKLLLKLQELFKSERERLTLRINFVGTDSETGDSIALIKYYTEKNIIFGHKFMIVGFWKEGNSSNHKWENFDKIFPYPENKIDEFLSIKIHDTEDKTDV